jgi:hypothetical protein
VNGRTEDKSTLPHRLLPCFCSFDRKLQDGGHAREHPEWKKVKKKDERIGTKNKKEKEVDGHGESNVRQLKCSDSATKPPPPPPVTAPTPTTKVSPHSQKRRYGDF